MALTEIPDDSITQAFGTNQYTEISLLEPYEANVDLTGVIQSLSSSASAVSAALSTVAWDYSASAGITQTETSPISILDEPVEQGQKLYQYSAKVPAQTSPCGLTVQWSVVINGTSTPVFAQHFMARYYMPLWVSLSSGVQGVLEAVVNTLEFLHDNSYGMSKPNVAENLQVRYSMEQISQCAQTSLLVWQSAIIQPTSYSLNSLPSKYYGLLYTATLRQLIFQLELGYLETPEGKNVDSPGADRREYYDRWKAEYDKLSDQYKTQLGIYEREQLDLCGSVNLVAGGYFGRSGALIRNQELQAMQNGVIQNQFFPVTIDFNAGPLAQ